FIMMTIVRWLTLPLLLASWLANSGSALAVGVRDDGGFFKEETIRKAETMIDEIKDRHQLDVVVETFRKIPDDMKKDYNPENKSQFFEQWARDRARKSRLTGVYVLLCKDPGHLQIEVGNKTGKKAFTPENRDELEKMFLKRLRAKEYDK